MTCKECLYEILDKWHNNGTTYYEFYCKYCIDIIVRTSKEKKGGRKI